MKSALLLSGGMDSAAIAYWKRPDVLFTVDYGQKPAAGEIRAAEAIAKSLEAEHEIIYVDVGHLGSGDLAGNAALSIANVPEWWPFRNQFLLTVAAMRAVALNVITLMIGSVRNDCIHADGKQEFIELANALFLTQEGGIRIEAPAITMTSVELCKTSQAPPEFLAWAHSCHKSEYACGCCRGCEKHYAVWKNLGFEPY